MVECFHRQLLCWENREIWYEKLSMILLGRRVAINDDLQVFSFELVYGTPLSLPGQLISRLRTKAHRHNHQDPTFPPSTSSCNTVAANAKVSRGFIQPHTSSSKNTLSISRSSLRTTIDMRF